MVSMGPVGLQGSQLRGMCQGKRAPEINHSSGIAVAVGLLLPTWWGYSAPGDCHDVEATANFNTTTPLPNSRKKRKKIKINSVSGKENIYFCV